MFVFVSCQIVVSVIRYGNRDAALIDDDENGSRVGREVCMGRGRREPKGVAQGPLLTTGHCVRGFVLL